MTKKIVWFVLTMVWCAIQMHAQEDIVRCATEEVNEYLRKKYPTRGETKDHFETWLTATMRKNASSRTTDKEYLIPTIIHIIHKGESVGIGYNIPYAQVLSQIQVLNEDFNRRNADTVKTPDVFKKVADALPIRFILADKNPNGEELVEKGVNRIRGEREIYTNIQLIEEIIKRHMWDPRKYFNIFVAHVVREGSTSSLLGFAFYPQSSGLKGIENDPIVKPDDISREEIDGVVIGTKYFGSNYTQHGKNFDIRGPFDAGRTATHEVGHWLGLRHIWGDGFSCTNDDFCDDTPAVFTHHDRYGVKETCKFPGPNQCYSFMPNDLPDMFQNYMDYTADSCMNLFTKCQVARMKVVLENSPRRKELTTNADLVTSLTEEETKNIAIFPNPTQKNVFVSFPTISLPAQICLLNQLGQVLASWQTTNTLVIDLEHHPEGIYFLQITLNGQIVTKKILKW
ncbi:MAG: M43 family zinc metalloprotease [Flammeovirgaceae bacterium]|nr:M43 family zinc metalloprotease [Flammeovirgaceae bacterium]MDW8287476.1 M43 family zinc metalloprotease [Flammeovirgaceae bacterium]